MATVYGGDFSAYSISGFVWSAEARISITAPQANLAGQAYVGRVAYNQFQTGLTVTQMIQLAEQVDMDKIILRAPIQNEDLIFDPSPTAADLQFEVCEYVIITTPALSITTNTPTAFNASIQFSLNYVYQFPYSNTFIASIDAAPEPQPIGSSNIPPFEIRPSARGKLANEPVLKVVESG